MSKFRVDHAARRDIAEIFQYIRSDNSAAADRMLIKLYDRFSLLANNPEMGELRPELSAGLRASSVGNYVIFFRRLLERIEIARVLHGARDVKSIFRQAED